MSDLAVSVVMTTYNGERFLARQIESILSQTLQPKEIIICDDGSSDTTLTILEKYHQSHGIIYHVNEKRLGVVNNFKKAVSLTSPGNYIALSDQDDIWLPEKLERSADALSNIDDGASPAMIYSDLIVIDQDEHVLSPSLNSELGFDKYNHCFSTLLFGNFVLGCTVMMNPVMKKFFLEIPGEHTFNHDAWITLVAFSFGKVALLQPGHILYRKHSHNVTFSNHKKSKRSDRIINHIRSVFVPNNFLHDQVILLREFLSAYRSFLSEKQAGEIAAVLQLEKASYLKKKIAFERSFKGKWTNRF